MRYYAFILGREAALSLAELLQVMDARKLDYTLEVSSSQMAVFSCQRDLSSIFNDLGGSIKVAHVRPVEKDELLQELMRTIQPPDKQRFSYGASVYKVDDTVSTKQRKRLSREIRKTLFSHRKKLRENGSSVRVVESKNDRLSSVVVQKNNLLSDHGVEVVIGLDTERAWIGQTLGVQDFEAFSERDYGRPHRDDRSGMLPPKLARMMLNLGGKKFTNSITVLDPFCGSGTVLQEALLMGAGKVLGSDLSGKAVEDAEQNIGWLSRQEKILGEWRIEQVDATEIHTWLPEESVDVAATEPYLGAPIRRSLSKGEIAERQRHLSELYDKTLSSLHKILKPKGRVVIIFPFIGSNRLPLPKSLGKHWTVRKLDEHIMSTERGGIDYRRPDQHVGREIFILEKM